MRPPSSKSSERSVIEKCTLETEKLFQAFLDVDKYKGYKETQEGMSVALFFSSSLRTIQK